MITRDDLAAIAQANWNVEKPKEIAASPSEVNEEATPKKPSKKRKQKRNRNQGELLLPIGGGQSAGARLEIAVVHENKKKVG